MIILRSVAVAGLMLGGIAAAQASGTNLTIRSAGGQDQFCMDAKADQKSEGTPVYLYRCHGRENQRWTVTEDVDGSTVLVGSSGLCLDVRGQHSKADGTPVQLWKCAFGRNQRFKLTADGNLREAESGKCLQALAQSDQKPIVLDNCTGAPSERWQLVP